MLKASELKRGSIVSIRGVPHVVEDLQIQTPSARGGASFYKVRFRNLITKQKEDGMFKGDDALEEAAFQKREVQYSYEQQGYYTFMDLEDYNEFTLPESEIEEQVGYLKPDMEGITALISEGRVLTIELPPVVELEVVQCDPSIRGASATARTKPATLSTGLVVQVPEYLSQGEVIRVDTRTAKFISRA